MSDDRSQSGVPVLATADGPAPVGQTDSGAPDAADRELQSPAMRALFEEAGHVALSDSTILITGETGVGKDWLARWLHAHSRRAEHAFVAINCASVPDTLLETQLFGHVRGAFTGAVHDAVGMFEAASGGTLFLDEIGDVSPHMQAKLLRVLQERTVQRVGEFRARAVDVRLLVATNKDLAEEVAEGRFRKDLFYRLLVIELHIPPLRERAADLSFLARDLLTRTAAKLNRPITGFTADAFAWLFQHDWPGNVRELEYVIEAACHNARGSEIGLEDLPPRIRPVPASRTPTAAKAAVDTRRLAVAVELQIDAALERHHGNRRRAADELGISLSTLKRRLRRRRAKRLQETARSEEEG
jgi:two-component system response regulator HydG